ncbi:MAG: hypothetical protein H7Y16_08500 [Candidatus Parcubacteria bacterium]|nr:hypothetical protein [Burkholderiales bacterium]
MDSNKPALALISTLTTLSGLALAALIFTAPLSGTDRVQSRALADTLTLPR